ncbi:hypothetical protein ACT453_40595, partial [Bacillus sp. D-CC]
YGFLSIFLGLGTVILHNVWTLNWQGLITLIAWLALLKSIPEMITVIHPQKKPKKRLTSIVTPLLSITFIFQLFSL